LRELEAALLGKSCCNPGVPGLQQVLTKMSDSRNKTDCLPRFSGLCNVISPKAPLLPPFPKSVPVLNGMLKNSGKTNEKNI